jgi:CBS-domain-containing membrane protein
VPVIPTQRHVGNATPGKEGNMRRKELLVASLCEAALIFVAGLAAVLTHKLLIFASLGPTAYEMVETPHSPTARPYNILVGHLIGVLAGLTALHLTHAWSTPSITTGATVWPRVLAAVLSVGLTVFFTLLLHATQPAAVSTTLLISLGTLQGLRGAAEIMCAVLLMTLVGEPLRRWRLYEQNRRQAPQP